MAYARARKDKPVLYGSGGGPGNPGHLAMEYFRQKAGFEGTHVPYKGNSEVVMGLVGGQIEVGFLATPGVLSNVQDGRLKALAVSGPRRISVAADIPTIAESGYPGFEIGFYQVMLAPVGIPESVRTLLEREVGTLFSPPSCRSASAHRRWSRSQVPGLKLAPCSSVLPNNGRQLSGQPISGLSDVMKAGKKLSSARAARTQIVMLGTGTPRPDPDRSGPATAIVANGVPYLFDLGQGVIRRAAAAYRKGITALGPLLQRSRPSFSLTCMRTTRRGIQT